MKIFYLNVWLLLLIANNICAQDAQGIQVDELVKTTSSWDGNLLPHYRDGQPEITILRIKIPPKTKLPWHKHPVINAGVVLRGELIVITEDNKKLKLKEGDSIVEVVNKWHYGINEGSELVEIIVFYAGVESTPISIHKKQ